MDTIKINKKNVRMVAHRGLASLEPENTLSAFVAAGNRSYFGIECDVRITKDGKFVVIHDDKTGRVAEKDIIIDESTFKKVRNVILDNICGNERSNLPQGTHRPTRGDLIIPTMEEYIEICKKYDKKCVLEVKNIIGAEEIDKLVEEVKETNYIENVIFISFGLENLINLRKRLPWQKLQYLVGEFNEGVLDVINKYNLDLDIYSKSVTQEVVDKVHKNGHIINCWTVCSAEEAEKLVNMGVDMITTENLE